MKKAVILLSGGVDSTTSFAIAKAQGFEVYALSFSYNQRHSIELEKAKQVAKSLGALQHLIINIDLSSFTTSALISSNIDVPKYDDVSEVGDNIPVTYVPARNTIFLSYALGFAEVIGANDIFVGVHAQDYANYPDTRPEYIEAFEKMANLATAAGVGGNKVTIHTPIINMTKAEIIKTGLELGVDYSITSSCYDPDEQGKPCGKCLACNVRNEGFAANGMKDPVL